MTMSRKKQFGVLGLELLENKKIKKLMYANTAINNKSEPFECKLQVAKVLAPGRRKPLNEALAMLIHFEWTRSKSGEERCRTVHEPKLPKKTMP